MARDNGLTEAKYQAIRDMYNELRKQDITVKRIWKELEKVFFLKQRTLEGIIYGEYQKRKLKRKAQNGQI